MATAKRRKQVELDETKWRRLERVLGDDADAHELRFHVWEIWGDFQAFAELLSRRDVSRAQLLGKLEGFLAHWPYHQDGVRYLLQKRFRRSPSDGVPYVPDGALKRSRRATSTRRAAGPTKR